MSLNVKIVPSTQTVQPGVGADGKVNTPAVTQTGAPEVRKIPGLTEYDPESGTVVPRKGFGSVQKDGETETVTNTLGAPAKETETETSRHDTWKQEQKAKREAKEQAQQAKAAKNQVLAKDFLRKGDLTGAAKALGLSPQEFALYAQNAMLSIPTKEEEPVKLTPEQQHAKEVEALRLEVDRLNQERNQEKFESNAQKWMTDNLDPVLADKEKFEFINRGDVAKVKRAVYDYMNKVYSETCTWNEQKGEWNHDGKQLNAAEVFETIEKEYEEAAVAALERNRDVKKLAKFYGPKEQEAMVQEAPETRTTNNAVVPGIDEARRAAQSLQEQLQTRVAQNGGNVRMAHQSNKPFALMTPHEKAMYFRNGGA